MLTVVMFIFISGCGSGESKVDDKHNHISLKNYSYDIDHNSYTLQQGKNINNPYQVYFSHNKENIIYTSINSYDEPEVYLYKKNEQIEKRLTNNVYIETNPVVNDNGTYAYTLSEYSVSKSRVYLDNELLKGKVGLYNHLDINNDYLIYNYEDFSKGTHYLQWLSLENKKIKTTQFFLGYIQKIRFISKETVLVQYYSLDNMSMDVGVFNIQSQVFTVLKNSKNDEIIKNVNFNESYTLSSVSSEEVNIKLLFNSYYNYYNFQLANPFSKSNNFMGRLTWNQSYRLTNLVALYKTTNNQNILKQIDYVIESLLDGVNEKIGISGDYNYKYSFSTKKYSLDKATPISLMVSDAKVYVSIVDAINNVGGELKAKYSPRVEKNVSGLLEYYNEYYIEDTGMYTFQYGISILFDGVSLPFNQQNIFSILMLDMYKLTTDKKYKNKAFQLADTFKKQFIYTDNKLIWHYWPKEFYIGWSENDKVSLNTPNRKKSEDNLYEDLSHAGINVSFIYKFQSMFPSEIFTSNDILLLHNTIDGVIYNNNFSRFMSGDIDYQDAEYRFLPKGGWSLLKHEKLTSFYTSLNPNIYPDFDSQGWGYYLNSINQEELKDEAIVIYSEKFDANKNFLKSISEVYKMSTVHRYFEEK